ncbi:iron ABC transporter permease [Streptomyces sp. WMMB303]|uniref:FecCD family ABC transporter permease n=1 Tax=Streptomyces sp. WMMB303 TaxID=3034154 RepID=UPI0023EC2C37|nr:iron ABC transporter permease [Streptomyces sp. WMMB303]MDF4250710.1 iron ABC transporter permease [Streptomyces sp. WMMB303]
MSASPAAPGSPGACGIPSGEAHPVDPLCPAQEFARDAPADTGGAGRVRTGHKSPPDPPPDSPPSPGPSAVSRAGLLLLGAVALLVSLAVSVRVGAADIGYTELARVVGARTGFDVTPLPRLRDSLIWDLRVPRVLMAALVGASLAACGAVLQAVTRNPLADPYLLGISSGASTGAVCVVVLGVGAGSFGVTGGAFAGALLSFGALLLLLRRTGLDSARIVLTGVVVAELFAALTALVLTASADAESTRAITHWLLGSMASTRWDAVLVCAGVCSVGLVLFRLYATALDAFAFGSDTAASLGIDVRAVRRVLLLATAVLTAVAVASVGAIGFVGLIVPHGVRFVVGPLHRSLLPYSALVGAVFLVWTDALARMAFAPQEVPVGVFTALLGVPLFLLVLRRRGEL